jgi:hypothetical protein
LTVRDVWWSGREAKGTVRRRASLRPKQAYRLRLNRPVGRRDS